MADSGTLDVLHVTSVASGRWRETAGRLVEAGGVAQSLFAARGPEGALEVRCLALAPDGPVLLRCAVEDGAVPSLADIVPALQWDEREARDLHGVVFSGHEPHRALVRPPVRSRRVDHSDHGRRRPPGRRGADPRGGDRVGALPLPRRG